MYYPDGQLVIVGDSVRLGEDIGLVMCSIDDGVYTERYPQARWSYLGRGVVTDFPNLGPIHYVEPEDGLRLITRAT
jgi:hypothetical protein